jgi:hypothetical protein
MRSLESMDCSCAAHPRSAPMAAMLHSEPAVNEKANLAGASTMDGSPATREEERGSACTAS